MITFWLCSLFYVVAQVFVMQHSMIRERYKKQPKIVIMASILILIFSPLFLFFDVISSLWIAYNKYFRSKEYHDQNTPKGDCNERNQTPVRMEPLS